MIDNNTWAAVKQHGYIASLRQPMKRFDYC
jgi:hypothetical protein